MSIDLSKQQALSSKPKALQHINFIGNLEQAGNEKMLFTIDEVKKTLYWISHGIVKVL